MVVCWDELDPGAYLSQLSDLADWITWLRATYRIPATVIPPCWFTHPGIREDIGHLWTGWLLTRHPDAGVGMIGLDWDQRRDATINRLREATAITGCTATRHQPEPQPAGAATNAVDQLWQDHLDSESQHRTRELARQAVVQVVTEILHAAELRHELAPSILVELADDSTTADDQQQLIAERLLELALKALERAGKSAADAASTVVDAQQHSAREAELADAREDIARSLASSALNNDSSPAGNEQLSHDWVDALERLLPAQIAAGRATAAAAARLAAVDKRAAARRRHPDIDHLLK